MKNIMLKMLNKYVIFYNLKYCELTKNVIL